MTSPTIDEPPFTEVIRGYVTELDALIPEVRQRIADMAWILECCDWLNGEYKKLGSTPEEQQRDREKVAQVEAAYAPKQERVNRIYRELEPRTAIEVRNLIRRVKPTLKAAPIHCEVVPAVRAEIERLTVVDIDGGIGNC